MTGITASGRREPTQAMLDYMRYVERWSGVKADAAAKHDFWSCHGYIAANEREARRRYAGWRAARPVETQRSRRVTEYVGGDYGIGNNDLGVSCYDYGIAPWGES